MSISKNTKIMMADGSKRAVEEVRIGDMVQTQDTYSSITNIGRGEVESLIEIKTSNDISIQLTNDHPVRVNEDGWKLTSELKVGDTLCIYNGKEDIISIEEKGGK